jgi:hypothetical protein
VAKQQRVFGLGEKLRVRKKSRLVDKDRLQEGSRASLPPLDVDVTGVEGEVCAPAYENAARGEVLVPIRLPNEAVIAVPEDRLERAGTPPPPSRQRAEERAVLGEAVISPVSPETIKFFERYFGARRRK